MPESLPTAGRFVSTELRELFDDSLDQMIADIGREVKLFFPPTASGCPNCFSGPDRRSNGIYDTANPFGLGQFNKPFPNGSTCPVCRGSHQILTESSTTYTGLLKWNPEDIDVTPYGHNPANVVRTKTQAFAKEDIKRATKAMIDGEVVVRITDGVPAGLGSVTKAPRYVKAFWVKQD